MRPSLPIAIAHHLAFAVLYSVRTPATEVEATGGQLGTKPFIYLVEVTKGDATNSELVHGSKAMVSSYAPKASSGAEESSRRIRQPGVPVPEVR